MTKPRCKDVPALLLFLSMLTWSSLLIRNVDGIILLQQQQKWEKNSGQKANVFGNQQNHNKNFQQLQRNIFYVASSALMLPTDWIDIWMNPMTEPPASSQAEEKRRKNVSEILQRGWSPDEGYGISDNEWIYMNSILKDYSTESVSLEDDGAGSNRDPSIYGEVTELGARQLFQKMGLLDHDKLKKNSNKHIFYDLGSGVGRLVTQAYMEIPQLSSAVGVELSPSRHQSALAAWGLVGKDAMEVRKMAVAEENERRNSKRRSLDATISSDDDIDNCCIEFRQGDLFQQDLSNVTHIYLASLCFTDDMIHQAARKLINEAPKLECVATLRKFPQHLTDELLSDGNNNIKRQPQTHRVEMTWTVVQGTGCVVHFYKPSRRHEAIQE